MRFLAAHVTLFLSLLLAASSACAYERTFLLSIGVSFDDSQHRLQLPAGSMFTDASPPSVFIHFATTASSIFLDIELNDNNEPCINVEGSLYSINGPLPVPPSAFNSHAVQAPVMSFDPYAIQQMIATHQQLQAEHSALQASVTDLQQQLQKANSNLIEASAKASKIEEYERKASASSTNEQKLREELEAHKRQLEEVERSNKESIEQSAREKDSQLRDQKDKHQRQMDAWKTERGQLLAAKNKAMSARDKAEVALVSEQNSHAQVLEKERRQHQEDQAKQKERFLKLQQELKEKEDDVFLQAQTFTTLEQEREKQLRELEEKTKKQDERIRSLEQQQMQHTQASPPAITAEVSRNTVSPTPSTETEKTVDTVQLVNTETSGHEETTITVTVAPAIDMGASKKSVTPIPGAETQMADDNIQSINTETMDHEQSSMTVTAAPVTILPPPPVPEKNLIASPGQKMKKKKKKKKKQADSSLNNIITESSPNPDENENTATLVQPEKETEPDVDELNCLEVKKQIITAENILLANASDTGILIVEQMIETWVSQLAQPNASISNGYQDALVELVCLLTKLHTVHSKNEEKAIAVSRQLLRLIAIDPFLLSDIQLSSQLFMKAFTGSTNSKDPVVLELKAILEKDRKNFLAVFNIIISQPSLTTDIVTGWQLFQLLEVLLYALVVEEYSLISKILSLFPDQAILKQIFNATLSASDPKQDADLIQDTFRILIYIRRQAIVYGNHYAEETIWKTIALEDVQALLKKISQLLSIAESSRNELKITSVRFFERTAGGGYRMTQVNLPKNALSTTKGSWREMTKALKKRSSTQALEVIPGWEVPVLIAFLQQMFYVENAGNVTVESLEVDPVRRLADLGLKAQLVAAGGLLQAIIEAQDTDSELSLIDFIQTLIMSATSQFQNAQCFLDMHPLVSLHSFTASELAGTISREFESRSAPRALFGWGGKALLSLISVYFDRPILLVLAKNYFSRERHIAILFQPGAEPLFINSEEIQQYLFNISTTNLLVIGYLHGNSQSGEGNHWFPLAIQEPSALPTAEEGENLPSEDLPPQQPDNIPTAFTDVPPDNIDIVVPQVIPPSTSGSISISGNVDIQEEADASLPSMFDNMAGFDAKF